MLGKKFVWTPTLLPQYESATQFSIRDHFFKGNINRIAIDYQGLLGSVKPGGYILIADGLISLIILSVNKEEGYVIQLGVRTNWGDRRESCIWCFRKDTQSI